MSYSDAISASMTLELLQSVGLELSIFAVTLAVAFAFRGLPFSKSKSRCQTKLSSPKKVDAVKQPRSAKAQSPLPQTMHSFRATGLTQKIELMVDFASRRQATEAIALYEEVKASGDHSAMKDILKSNKQQAASAYSQLIQSAGRVTRPELVESLLDDMIQSGVERSLAFYESTMKMLASKKHYKEALSVCSRLEADGLEPSPVTLSCLVNFAVEIGESERAIAFFQRLSASSTPSIRAYMTILRVHSKRQDWCKSLATIRDMQEREAPIDSLVLNIVLATGVAAGKLEAAQSLLKEFSDRRVTDVVSFNTVLKGLAQQKHVDKAMQLLEEMCQSGKRPNSITFNTVMDAAVRSLRVTDAWRVLNRMRDSGLVPDKFTCTTLMKGLQNGVTTEQLAVILDLLGNMAADGDASVYSFLFRKVVEAVAQVKNPQLTAKAAEHLRKQRAMLPAHEYRQLLQSLIQDVEPKKCGMSYSLAASHSTRPVAVC